MDEAAIDRAKRRIEERADTAALDGVLERTRADLELLAQTAAEAVEGLPSRIQDAVETGLREQALPLGRNVAELRGLMNGLLRRLETLEGDSTAERHARIDDLALLVDLISSGWRSVDARLERVETLLQRLEREVQERDGASVYRLDDRVGQRDR